jgi:hypothetical protein
MMSQEDNRRRRTTSEVGSDMARNLTGTELLGELTRARDRFTWRVTRKGRIRGSLNQDKIARTFDPVTAVVYIRTSEFFSEGQWAEAASAIGLEYSACAEIIAASNYEWDPSCRQGELRRQLLDSLIPDMKSEKSERDCSSLVNVFLRSSRRGSPNTR